MLPFAAQVNVAISFLLRGCCSLAGREVIGFNHGGSLQQQIARTIEYFEAIPEQAFEGAAERLCHDRAGFADIAPSQRHEVRYANWTRPRLLGASKNLPSAGIMVPSRLEPDFKPGLCT